MESFARYLLWALLLLVSPRLCGFTRLEIRDMAETIGLPGPQREGFVQKIEGLTSTEKRWLKKFLQARLGEKITADEAKAVREIVTKLTEQLRVSKLAVGSTALITTLLIGTSLTCGLLCAMVLKHTIATLIYGVGAASALIASLYLLSYLMKHRKSDELGANDPQTKVSQTLLRSLINRLSGRMLGWTWPAKSEHNTLPALNNNSALSKFFERILA